MRFAKHNRLRYFSPVDDEKVFLNLLLCRNSLSDLTDVKERSYSSAVLFTARLARHTGCFQPAFLVKHEPAVKPDDTV